MTADPSVPSACGETFHHEETAPLVGFTVRPGSPTEICLQGLPDSVCSLAPEGAEAGVALKIFADPEGEIRFHVHFEQESHPPARLVVTSTAGGQTQRLPVHLRSAHEESAALPFPAPRRAYCPAGARVRPALSRAEALRLTDAEAHVGGYPPRPDQATVPDAFDHWLRGVTVPTTMIEPRRVANPETTRGASFQPTANNSDIWCGYQSFRPAILTGPVPFLAPPFAEAYGVWFIPPVTGEAGKKSYSSLWVGLVDSSHLAQAGTEQDCLTFPIPNGSNVHYSTYYAWTEFLPEQPHLEIIANFPVRPGDQIITDVWVGNAGSLPSVNGDTAFFSLWNLTTNVSTTVTTPVGSTRLRGDGVLWIAERPTFNIEEAGGTVTDLANFGSASMGAAHARLSDPPRSGGHVGYQGDNAARFFMVNQKTNHLLSVVVPTNDSEMRFIWTGFS